MPSYVNDHKSTIKINGISFPVVAVAQTPPWMRDRRRTKWHSYLTPDELPYRVNIHGGGMGYGRDTGSGAGYAYSQNITVALPYQVGIPASLTHITTTNTGTGWNLQLNAKQWSRYYLAGGRYVTEFTNGAETAEYDLGAGVTATDLAFYNSKLFVANDGGVPKIFSATGLTSPAAGGINIERMVPGRKGASGAAWASSPNSNFIYSLIGTADPTVTGNWNGPFPVSDASSAITQMYMLDAFTYVHKTDGLYAVDDSGNFRILLPELRLEPSPLNGVGGSVWFAGILVPEQYGLIYYNGDVGYHFGPETIQLNDTPVRGTPISVTVIGKYVWTIVNGSDGNAYVLWGREAGQGDSADGPMLWHTVYSLDAVTYGAPKSVGLAFYTGAYHLRIGTSTGIYDATLDALGRPLAL